MKKYKTERTRKRRVFVMAFVMIGSVFGVMLFGYYKHENKAKYNDFLFVHKENLWFTKVYDRVAVFNYLPDDVVNINLENDFLTKLTNLVEIDTTL